MICVQKLNANHHTETMTSTIATQMAFKLAPKGILGRNNHDSTQTPFMLPNVDASVEKDIPRQNVYEIEALLQRAPLPESLKYLYMTLGYPRRECVFGNWTLMSLNKVVHQYQTLRDTHGQGEVLDFAISYAGMGHVVVASYAITLQKVFYRLDGGANDYDRRDNELRLRRFKPYSTCGTWFPMEHWFECVESQLSEKKSKTGWHVNPAYDPMELPLTMLP